MTIDIMIMIKTSNIITAMTMKGKVNGMEEEMVIIGKEDTLKIMGNLVMEVGREDVEEGTMEGVEAIAEQMTEGSEVDEAVGDFKGELLLASGNKLILSSFEQPRGKTKSYQT